MKVVFFCGGLGTRLREYSSTIPKPMVAVGERPILWHLMKYYAHFGHTEFILCLGYKGNVIKQYFVNGMEHVNSQDGVIELCSWKNTGWRVTLLETGEKANIGQRLLAAQPYVGQDEVFLANYSDGLSDLPLDEHIRHFYRYNKVASFVSVRPTNSFHAVETDTDGLVHDIRPAGESGFWINGGFFIFRSDIFNYVRDGEELVEAPFKRLIADKQLHSYLHNGFWACMDTPKDKNTFDNLSLQKDKLWRVWL